MRLKKTMLLQVAVAGALLVGGASLARAQNTTAGDNTDSPIPKAVHHRHHRTHRAATTATGAPPVASGAVITASRPNGGTGNAGNSLPAPGPGSAAPGSMGNPPAQSKDGNGGGGGGS